jgi:hypothetical protein
MAIWNLAVAWSHYGSDVFPKASVYWLGVKGGQAGAVTKGYASFDEALGELMKEGWEPFSAHRWEDFAAYGPEPMKTTGALPIRDYVWFRRAVKGKGPVTRGATTTAEARPPKPRP